MYYVTHISDLKFTQVSTAFQPGVPQKGVQVSQCQKGREFEVHPVPWEIQSVNQEMEQPGLLWFAGFRFCGTLGLGILLSNISEPLFAGLQVLGHSALAKFAFAKITYSF